MESSDRTEDGHTSQGREKEPDPVVRNFHLDLPEQPIEVRFLNLGGMFTASFLFIWVGIYRAFLDLTLPDDIASRNSQTIVPWLVLFILIPLAIKFAVTWNWKIVLSKQGLTFSKGSKTVQECSWEAMTVRKKFFLLPALADQNNRFFPFGIFTNGSPDNFLIVKYLGQKLQASAPLNTKRLRWLGPIFISFLITGFIGYYKMTEYAPRVYAARQIVSFDSAKLQQQLQLFHLFSWMTGLIMLIPVYVYIYHALMPYLEFRNAAYKHKDEIEAAEIIGKEINFEPGIWYDYGEVSYTSASARVISAAGWLCSFIVTYVICSAANRAWPYAGAFIGAILVPTVAAITLYLWFNREPFKRGFQVKLRKIHDHFEVLNEDEVSVLKPLSFKQNNLRSGANLGGLKWDFKTKDGVLYSFDPRFMMPLSAAKPQNTEP